jgi:predicted aconitase with swiveling domain
MEIKAHRVSAGKAEGEAVVYEGPFAFLGDLNPATGKICLPRHRLEGVALAGKIFVFTTGKGSSGCDFAAWAAKKKGNAPAAMICLESEPVLSGAAIAAEIPTVDHPDADIFRLIKTGDRVTVDATEGVITIK